MKRIFTVLVCLTFLSSASASFATDVGGISVTERGPHHRILSRVSWETNLIGKVVAHTNSYTELATGMHYLKDNQWVESKAEIKLVLGGAEAVDGSHKVKIAANLNSTNAVQFTTPDGKQLRSRIFGLAYYDSSSGQVVLIGRTRDSIGELFPPDRVLFPRAFDGADADIEYVYSKAGFSQNVVIRSQLPAPEKWNLNSATTKLQAITEFFDPPEPEKILIPMRSRNDFSDETLRFGSSRIGPGRGFAVGEQSDLARSVRISKHWIKLDSGRTFLVEEVKFKAVEARTQSLPAAPRSARLFKPTIGHGETLVAALDEVVPRLPSGKPKRGEMRLAKADVRETTLSRRVERVGRGPERGARHVAKQYAQRPGFVLDYEMLNGATDLILKADTTYYVTNAVWLNGTTTIEGGAVVKFSTNPAAKIYINETLICNTAPYRMAIFTAKDDNSAGETILGSTGNPLGYYGGAGLYLWPLNHIRNIRANYLNVAFENGEGGDNSFSDVQIVKCRVAFTGTESSNIKIENGLISEIEKVVCDALAWNFVGNHLTVDQCDTFVSSIDTEEEWTSSFCITNSLLTSVTNWTDNAYVNFTTNTTVWLTDNTEVFQTVGAGAHYLAEDSPYRDAGTTDINLALLADLRNKTTFPPIAYTMQKFTNDTVLFPRALRDADVPDLGYHYDPLDYAFGVCVITNASMTLLPGTTIGMFSAGYGYGLAIFANSHFRSLGTPTEPNWIVRYNMVQEQANQTWTNSFSDYSIVGDWLGGTAPDVTCRFTKWSAAANGNYQFSDYNSAMPISFADCEFHGGKIRVQISSASITNCLFNRSHSIFDDSSYGIPSNITLRNCLFYGGTAYLEHWDAGTWTVKDNLFDHTAIYQTFDFDTDYNGYIAGSARITPNGAHDVVTNLVFTAGPLGNFYQTNTSAFIHAGSTAASNIGLYHYTVATNLNSALQIKETNSVVDIGYHYVALNSSGQPIDTDGDGTEDYLEDSNGDGAYAAGDRSNWQQIEVVPGGSTNAASTNSLQWFIPVTQ
jgi:hypothetical protein